MITSPGLRSPAKRPPGCALLGHSSALCAWVSSRGATRPAAGLGKTTAAHNSDLVDDGEGLTLARRHSSKGHFFAAGHCVVPVAPLVIHGASSLASGTIVESVSACIGGGRQSSMACCFTSSGSAWTSLFITPSLSRVLSTSGVPIAFIEVAAPPRARKFPGRRLAARPMTCSRRVRASALLS